MAVLCRLLRPQRDNHQGPFSHSDNWWAPWWTGWCTLVFQTRSLTRLPPNSDEWRRYPKDYLQNSPWPLWVLGHAFQALQYPFFVSGDYEHAFSDTSSSIYRRVLWWYFDIQMYIQRPCLSFENCFPSITRRTIFPQALQVFFCSDLGRILGAHGVSSWCGTNLDQGLGYSSVARPTVLKGIARFFGTYGILSTFHQRLRHHTSPSEQIVDEGQICLVQGSSSCLH